MPRLGVEVGDFVFMELGKECGMKKAEPWRKPASMGQNKKGLQKMPREKMPRENAATMISKSTQGQQQ